MSRYIDLDELLKYPIRIDHYDKEYGNINFVHGTESVIEYAEHLPIYEVLPTEPDDAKGITLDESVAFDLTLITKGNTGEQEN